MGCTSCCRGDEDKPRDPKKEICRLKLNWFFMMMIAALYAISYTSLSSSFHQFITNPKDSSINRSVPGMEEVEPGLGESEAFYSWVITVFNVGAILGSLSGGLLLKWVPYWHLLLGSLVFHTLGYILYAVASTGWLIMLSKLLSGIFIGAEMTLALAYFGESNSSYKTAIKELGKEDGKATRVKHQLFALHSVGINIGYVFGPGVAVIFAQFPINQFRSIAWYNAVAGIAIIAVQLLIFRGESDCTKLTNCSWKSRTSKQPRKTAGPETTRLSRALSLGILVFLVVGRAILSFRFCVYETLFNPILSDSFGFTERDASYFFFGLVAAQICGTVVLLVLQQLRLSSRLVAVIGLVMSISGTLLMGDWQAIPHDPCTEASLFHHPELLHTYTAQLEGAPPPLDGSGIPSKEPSMQCERLNLSLSMQQHLRTKDMDVYVYPNIVDDDVIIPYGCEEVESCPQCSDQQGEYRTYSASPTCLHLHIDPLRQCLEPAPSLPWQPRPHPLSRSYSCNMPRSLFQYCLTVRPHPTSSNESSVGSMEEYVADVHIQSVQIVEGRVGLLAVQSCENHDGGHCHWNPDSSVIHRRCEDCPPICRDRTNYLEFSQFAIAATILMVAIPVARVPITSLISDIVSGENQGIVMGMAQALNAVARSVGPLWLDAAYEGVEKRTFLAMALCVACYLAILVGVLLLYPKLTPPPRSSKSTTDSDSDSESDYTTIQHMDSFSDSDFVP